MLTRFGFLIMAAALLSACAFGAPAAITGGIEGQVFIGPICPVETTENPCPDQPFQATITVLDQSGQRVTQFETDAEGKFRVPLNPGTYVLRPEPPGVTDSGQAGPQAESITRAGEQTVSVASGQFTQVTVTYDSGIR